MTEAAKQIMHMAQAGIAIEDIANALGHDHEAVRVILTALEGGKKKKNIPVSVNLGTKESTTTSEETAPLGFQDGETAEEIYKKNQAAVARKLVQTALYDSENVAAATKAAIYINEEATGRNEARAKKQNNVMLLHVGEALLNIKNAASRVEMALGKAAENGCINNLAAIDV